MTVVESAPRMFPVEPGRYDDIDEAVYHGRSETLSSTGARLLVSKTPAHFDHERRMGRKPKVEFDVGSAFHRSVLGMGAELEVLDFDSYTTKAARDARDAAYEAGKTPLTRPQGVQVERMVAAVRAHPVAGKLFARTDCQPEVTFVGRDPETGVLCRARTDWLLPIVDGKPIRYVDLKSTTDASRHGMAKSMSDFGYPSQFDFYNDTIRWALGLPDDYPVIGTLVATEKEAPHLVGLGQPDEQALAWAHEDNRKARHLFARCTETGEWPGYGTEIVPLSLPGWRLAAYEANYPTGAFRPDDEFGEWWS